MIHFNCENCEQKIKVPDEYAGKGVKCPKCGDKIAIPKADPIDSINSQDNSYTQQPCKITSMISFKCQMCGEDIIVPESVSGKIQECPNCGCYIEVAGAEILPVTSSKGQEQHSVSSATKNCPFCGEAILLVARKCKHCGEFLEEIYAKKTNNSHAKQTVMPTRQYQSETLGIIMIFIPLAASFLIWFWVGNMSLLQNPASVIMMLNAFTVISTSILFSIEASNLGMGSGQSGGKETGPITWLFGGLLLWIVVYPMYLYKRKHYGLRNLCVPGLVVALIMIVSSAIMICAIENLRTNILNEINEIFNF